MIYIEWFYICVRWAIYIEWYILNDFTSVLGGRYITPMITSLLNPQHDLSIFTCKNYNVCNAFIVNWIIHAWNLRTYKLKKKHGRRPNLNNHPPPVMWQYWNNVGSLSAILDGPENRGLNGCEWQTVTGVTTLKVNEIIKLIKCCINNMGPCFTVLTHWGQDKMAAIFQTFSNAFSWMKIYKFWLKLHLSLFPRVQLTIFQE